MKPCSRGVAGVDNARESGGACTLVALLDSRTCPGRDGAYWVAMASLQPMTRPVSSVRLDRLPSKDEGPRLQDTGSITVKRLMRRRQSAVDRLLRSSCRSSWTVSSLSLVSFFAGEEFLCSDKPTVR